MASVTELIKELRDKTGAGMMDCKNALTESDGDIEKAKRAVGLFNAYCARCHTAGYSAGVAYTKEIASGGLGPALRAGRVNIQFKQREDFIDFIIKGSVNGKAYGVNGVGGGKMPGFGAVLPQSDIELVIDYLRGMEPDA